MLCLVKEGWLEMIGNQGKKLTKTTQESHRRRQQSGIIVMCTYANRAAVGTKQSPEKT